MCATLPTLVERPAGGDSPRLWWPILPPVVLDLPMDLHRETRYAAAPEVVFAMLVDEAFLRRRAEASHALSHDIGVTHGDGTATSTVRQSLPAEVPDIFRKLVGESVDLTEVIEWDPAAPDRTRSGELTVEVANVPVTLRGTIELVMDGAGTLQTVDAELKAAVPLIGRKIEEAALPAVIAGIDGMEQLGGEWLGTIR